MQSNFYNSVTGWIASCINATQLGWIQRMVDKSHEAADVKAKLRQEIINKMNSLRYTPAFNDDNYLVDEHGHPRVYTTRFSAICKLAELKMKGYEAELRPGDVFYKIVLIQDIPVQDPVYGN